MGSSRMGTPSWRMEFWSSWSLWTCWTRREALPRRQQCYRSRSGARTMSPSTFSSMSSGFCPSMSGKSEIATFSSLRYWKKSIKTSEARTISLQSNASQRMTFLEVSNFQNRSPEISKWRVLKPTLQTKKKRSKTSSSHLNQNQKNCKVTWRPSKRPSRLSEAKTITTIWTRKREWCGRTTKNSRRHPASRPKPPLWLTNQPVWGRLAPQGLPRLIVSQRHTKWRGSTIQTWVTLICRTWITLTTRRLSPKRPSSRTFLLARPIARRGGFRRGRPTLSTSSPTSSISLSRVKKQKI